MVDFANTETNNAVVEKKSSGGGKTHHLGGPRTFISGNLLYCPLDLRPFDISTLQRQTVHRTQNGLDLGEFVLVAGYEVERRRARLGHFFFIRECVFFPSCVSSSYVYRSQQNFKTCNKVEQHRAHALWSWSYLVVVCSVDV